MSQPIQYLLPCAVVLACAGSAAQAQEAPVPRYGHISIWQRLGDPQPDRLRPVLSIGDEDSWVRPADYPADALAANVQGEIEIRVSVDATGRITGCTSEAGADERLRQLACSLVSERGRFRHALSANGAPVAAEARLLVQFMITRTPQPHMLPPAPPGPPPGGYPYTPSLEPVKLDWKPFAPPGKPSGEVAVRLDILPADRDGRRLCRIESSSGDATLDDATCAAVRAGEYSPRPGARPTVQDIRMLVRWKKGKARYELPHRLRGAPSALAGGDAAAEPVLPAGAVTQWGAAMAVFRPDGRIDCQIRRSTGSDATDSLICAHLKGLTFTPALDIYGRPIPETRYFRYAPR